MLINEVALGNMYDVYQHQTSLTKAPDGFDSVHGVRNQDGNDSQFEVCHTHNALLCMCTSAMNKNHQNQAEILLDRCCINRCKFVSG